MPVPLPRGVVVLIKDVSGPENPAEVPPVRIGVQVVLGHKVLNPRGPHKVIGIAKVDFLDGDPVPRQGVAIIRDPLGDPVVPGDDFHVPDFIAVGKDDPITFSGTILSNLLAEVFNPVACRVNKGEG